MASKHKRCPWTVTQIATFIDCAQLKLFLSDPSPIIGFACHSLTNWLPFSKLDWCDLGVWRWQLKTCWSYYCCWCWWWGSCCCRFGCLGIVIKLNFCSDFGHKVWSRFWNWSSGEILKLKFVQYFAADVSLRLRSWILVKILKLCRFRQDFNFKFSRDTDVLLKFWS